MPPCLNKHHPHEDISGSGDTLPLFLNLGAVYRWVVSFTPWPLYPQIKRSLQPLNRTPVGCLATLDTLENRNISCFCRWFNRDLLAAEAFPSHYTNRPIQLPLWKCKGLTETTVWLSIVFVTICGWCLRMRVLSRIFGPEREAVRGIQNVE